MKKVILSLALLISVASFAQKEELKTLKKLYSRDNLSTSDLGDYKSALGLLETSANAEADVIYRDFYKGMLPLLELNTLGEKATPADQMRIFSPKALESFSNSVAATLEFEKKTGKDVYTTDIKETLSWFKPMLNQIALQFNSSSKFKEGSALFYAIYKLDKNDGSNLENAAILAVQGQDYVIAEKLYREYYNSDYFNNSVSYFAINKASEQEEFFPTREARMKSIGSGFHEKPREEKVSTKKPEISKIIAVLTLQNGNLEEAKKAYKIAKELNPEDVEVLTNEANLYYQTNDLGTYEKLVTELISKDPNNASLHFNIGYLSLSEDQSLVDQINANTGDTKKYNELIEKRKVIFKKALPHFEKAYELNATDANTKQLLKMSYDILGMKEKSAMIK